MLAADWAGERLQTTVDQLVVSKVLFASEPALALGALKLANKKVCDVDVSVQVVLRRVRLEAFGVVTGIH